MLSAVSNVVHVNVHLDEFLKCFIVQGQRQVRHRPCVIKKPAGDFFFLKRTRQLWLISMQLSMDSTLAQLWVIYPGYRAVRLREVLAKPEVGACVPLALGLSWHMHEERER